MTLMSPWSRRPWRWMASPTASSQTSPPTKAFPFLLFHSQEAQEESLWGFPFRYKAILSSFVIPLFKWDKGGGMLRLASQWYNLRRQGGPFHLPKPWSHDATVQWEMAEAGLYGSTGPPGKARSFPSSHIHQTSVSSPHAFPSRHLLLVLSSFPLPLTLFLTNVIIHTRVNMIRTPLE